MCAKQRTIKFWIESWFVYVEKKQKSHHLTNGWARLWNDSCIIWHFTHLIPCCLFTFSVRFAVCFCLGSKPTNFDATYKCPWHMDQIAPRVCIHINHHPDRWTQQPFQWIELPPFCPRHFLSSAFLVFMLYKEERKNTGPHSNTWKRIIYNFRRKVTVF